MNRRVGWALLALALGSATCGAWARGPWRADQGNTPGWFFMTPAERVEHQARIRGFRSYDECQRYRDEHHRLILERAREAGREAGGGRDFCAHLLPPDDERRTQQ